MNKVYKYRIYPTKKQAEILPLLRHSTRKCIRSSKNRTALPLPMSRCSFQPPIRTFFENRNFGFPRFKSKKNPGQSYTTNNQHGTVAVGKKSLQLPKLKHVKAVIHLRTPEGFVLKSATVSMEPDGTFYCSVLYEYSRTIVPVKADISTTIGLDYKSDGLYVDSNKNKADMPHWYRLSERKLAVAQRRASRKVLGSKNRINANLRTAKISRHAANQRFDYLHKKSIAIAKRYSLVAAEDLNMISLPDGHEKTVNN
jgi:putative transposase